MFPVSTMEFAKVGINVMISLPHPINGKPNGIAKKKLSINSRRSYIVPERQPSSVYITSPLTPN